MFRGRPKRLRGQSKQYRAGALARLLTFSALWLLAPLSVSSRAAAPTEYQLKAAFLLNFAKFVEWPATVFRSQQSPFSICVLGNDPFGHDLDDTVKGQTIGNRTVAVKRISQIPRDDGCQMIFVSSADGDKWQRGFDALKSSPVLTVVERDDLMDNVVINLKVEENKIRFEVNLEAAEHAGLRISSKLLRLAKSVRERRRS
jgi:hypothetical protein